MASEVFISLIMRKRILLFLLVCFGLQLSTNAQTTSTVQPFLPELVTQFPNVRDIAISPSSDEVYFTVQSYREELSVIVFSKKIKDKWSKPVTAVFSGQFNDLEPFFSADGLRLYFASNRPMEAKGKETKDYDIWYVERKSVRDSWSEPINMGAPVNSKNNEFYPSIAANNNLYFTSDAETASSKDNIYMCKWVNGKYDSPLSLGDSVNTAGYEFNAFVAPDESYLLFTAYNRKEGLGSGDLYISYKRNGNWSAATNVGTAINSTQMDYCPFVDTQNGILYFTSKRNSVAKQFEKRETIEVIQKEMGKYENGQSRLYMVKFSSIKK